MLKVVRDDANGQTDELALNLDDLAHEGARRMLMDAREAEVTEYVGRFRGARDENGRAMVVRNGTARTRKMTMGAGTVEVTARRINDRRVDADGNRQRFTNAILPPYMRRLPKVAEVLPILNLRGLSTGDFQEALKALLGEEASGLSPANINKLLSVWGEEYERFGTRDLQRARLRLRLGGRRSFQHPPGGGSALHTGVCSGRGRTAPRSSSRWRTDIASRRRAGPTCLRDLKRRGMRAPVLAIGDGALGFWGAVRDVWPETREQRDWVHRIGNVLDKLPKRQHPKAKAALHEVMRAESRKAAEQEIETFCAEYGAKYPKAVESLTRDQDKLLTFFDFPAEHWVHIRTSNPIESAFSTVRIRQRVTESAGSRKRRLMMAFKLLEMAQQRWRRLNGSELLPLVRAGVLFKDGEQVKRIDQVTTKEAAEIAA